MTKKLNEIGWNFHNSYSRLPKSFFTSQSPTSVRLPKLIIFNEQLGNRCGFEYSGIAR